MEKGNAHIIAVMNERGEAILPSADLLADLLKGTPAYPELSSVPASKLRQEANRISAPERYQMSFTELQELYEALQKHTYETLCLSFDLGFARGCRFAQNEAKRRAKA